MTTYREGDQVVIINRNSAFHGRIATVLVATSGSVKILFEDTLRIPRSLWFGRCEVEHHDTTEHADPVHVGYTDPHEQTGSDAETEPLEPHPWEAEPYPVRPRTWSVPTAEGWREWKARTPDGTTTVHDFHHEAIEAALTRTRYTRKAA